MDEIFDRKNFLNDIIWNSTKSVTNTALISVSHTHNLVYFRNLSYFTKNRTKFRLVETGDGFSNPDNDPRGDWKADPFQVGGWRPNQQYDIINPKTGIIYKPNEGCSWKNEKKVYDELVLDNRIVFGSNGDSGPQRKRFLSEALERGKVSKTIWDDVGTTTNGTQHLKELFEKIVFSNPKPESFLKRIIELSTSPSDIVLDYHLGSGTTAAVAHKMGRQYIGIEQMDYIENVCVERMKKVISGEQGGISRSVEWDGGGDFVYFELKQYNQAFIEQIVSADSTERLLQIWEDMKERSFLDYNVDLQKHEKYLSDFIELDLDSQKQHLIGLLDKNKLYVNLSSIDDVHYANTDEEKRMTREFYGN
jgi:adenine-specific DNA-methyltransferase